MKPDYRILLNGSDQTETIRPFFSSATVSDRDGTELDTATLELSYQAQIEIPDRGATLELDFGYEGSDNFKVFKGVINKSGVKGFPEKLVLQATGLALSDDKRLQGSQTRTYNNQTLGEIAQDIIQEAGFNARIHKNMSNIEVKRFMQTIETDLQILQRLAGQFGGFLKSDGETIAVLPERSQDSVTGENLPSVRIEKGVTPLSSYGWSVNHRKFKGIVVAFYAEDGKTRSIQRGSGSPETRLKTIYATKKEAEMAAQNEIARFEASRTFSAALPGQDIAVGSPLNVSNFPGSIDGQYWVRSVDHSVDDTFKTQIEATR